MNTNLPDTKNATWKNDKSRFGYKFLQKFGWSDEKGLGKDESGMTSSISVSKREDSLGLGAEKMTDGAGAKGWGETQSGFNSILETLKSEYGDSKSKKKMREKNLKKKKKNKSSSDIVDDDEPRITVGMKYKKLSDAKSLKGKSEVDMRAVLGVGKRSVDNEAFEKNAEPKNVKEKKKRPRKKDVVESIDEDQISEVKVKKTKTDKVKGDELYGRSLHLE